MEKKRLFVDMDGTIAVFHPVNKLEQLYEPGYFRNLEPMENVIKAVKELQQDPQIDVFILSACLADSPYALQEKNQWLDQYLPTVDQDHRIFLPCGADKKDYIPEGIRKTDFLLDDYTNNLVLWQPPARGIKILNGINHTRGTWKGDKVKEGDPDLADKIISAMRLEERTFRGFINYGCLCAEKRPIFSAGELPAATAKTSEPVEFVVPLGWSVGESTAGRVLIESPWGENYMPNDLLEGEKMPYFSGFNVISGMQFRVPLEWNLLEKTAGKEIHPKSILNKLRDGKDQVSQRQQEQDLKQQEPYKADPER